MKFFQCAHCGNIIAYVEDKGVPVMCLSLIHISEPTRPY